jgi:hypothetical protein
MPTQQFSHLKFQFPENKTTIILERTPQVPNDGVEHKLPQATGEFTYSFDGTRRIVPMNEEDALWLKFNNSNVHAPVAIKVMAGGRNAVTGLKETDDTYTALKNNGADGKGQNYMLVTDGRSAQQWLDGFMSGNGVVRQFIAVALGQGKSVEEKLDGTQRGGLQIIVVPTKYEIVEKRMAEVREQQRLADEAREKRDREKTVRAMLIDASIKEKEKLLAQKREKDEPSPEEILELEKEINALRLEHSRLTNTLMRLIPQKAYGEELDSLVMEDYVQVDKLQDLEDKSQDLSYSSMDSHRASKKSSSSSFDILGSIKSIASSIKKMGLGGGGKIKQDIVASDVPVDNFDPAQAQFLDLNLISAEEYAELIKLPIPPREPTAQEYTNAGHLWLDLLSSERAVRTDAQSSPLVTLEEAGTLSALPQTTNTLTIPSSQIVSIGSTSSFFSSLLPTSLQSAFNRPSAAETTQTSTAAPSTSPAP